MKSEEPEFVGFQIRTMRPDTRAALKIQAAVEKTNMTEYLLGVLNEDLTEKGYSECRRWIPKIRR